MEQKNIEGILFFELLENYIKENGITFDSFSEYKKKSDQLLGDYQITEDLRRKKLEEQKEIERQISEEKRKKLERSIFQKIGRLIKKEEEPNFKLETVEEKDVLEELKKSILMYVTKKNSGQKIEIEETQKFEKDLECITTHPERPYFSYEELVSFVYFFHDDDVYKFQQNPTYELISSGVLAKDKLETELKTGLISQKDDNAGIGDHYTVEQMRSILGVVSLINTKSLDKAYDKSNHSWDLSYLDKMIDRAKNKFAKNSRLPEVNEKLQDMTLTVGSLKNAIDRYKELFISTVNTKYEKERRYYEFMKQVPVFQQIFKAKNKQSTMNVSELVINNRAHDINQYNFYEIEETNFVDAYKDSVKKQPVSNSRIFLCTSKEKVMHDLPSIHLVTSEYYASKIRLRELETKNTTDLIKYPNRWNNLKLSRNYFNINNNFTLSRTKSVVVCSIKGNYIIHPRHTNIYETANQMGEHQRLEPVLVKKKTI